MNVTRTTASLCCATDIVEERDNGRGFSGTASNYWSRPVHLFSIIADGDDAVGMRAYNGGPVRMHPWHFSSLCASGGREARAGLYRRPLPFAPRTSARLATSIIVTSLFRIWAASMQCLLEFIFVQEQAGATIVARPGEFRPQGDSVQLLHPRRIRRA